jgi:hypothetical protein
VDYHAAPQAADEIRAFVPVEMTMSQFALRGIRMFDAVIRHSGRQTTRAGRRKLPFFGFAAHHPPDEDRDRTNLWREISPLFVKSLVTLKTLGYWPPPRYDDVSKLTANWYLP